MSKTVKRVMTVMMIGLVALLGARAEAHTRWFNGKPRVCSICDDKDGKEGGASLELPDGWAPLHEGELPPHIGVAELIVTTRDVAITCKDITVVRLKGAKNQATLTDERPSKGWLYDTTTDPHTAFPNFKIVPEQLYEILGFFVDCEGTAPKVQILQMTAEYKVSECTTADCLSRVLLSTMKLNGCNVPLNAQLGTAYKCEDPIFEHKHPTPTQDGR